MEGSAAAKPPASQSPLPPGAWAGSHPTPPEIDGDAPAFKMAAGRDRAPLGVSPYSRLKIADRASREHHREHKMNFQARYIHCK